MSPKLRPIDQQVIVVTGASSGIGLATALTAASRGAQVVLTARSEQTLLNVVRHIEETGGRAFAVAADIADRQYDEPPRDPRGTLDKPGEEGRIRGSGPAPKPVDRAAPAR